MLKCTEYEWNERLNYIIQYAHQMHPVSVVADLALLRRHLDEIFPADVAAFVAACDHPNVRMFVGGIENVVKVQRQQEREQGQSR